MQRDPKTLIDILQAARLIVTFLGDSDEVSFSTDLMRQSAIERQIMIIGEAVKRLSMDFRTAHPHIPWTKIAGMRGALIHGYDIVDAHIVWEVACINIPALIADIEPLVDTDAE